MSDLSPGWVGNLFRDGNYFSEGKPTIFPDSQPLNCTRTVSTSKEMSNGKSKRIQIIISTLD